MRICRVFLCFLVYFAFNRHTFPISFIHHLIRRFRLRLARTRRYTRIKMIAFGHLYLVYLNL